MDGIEREGLTDVDDDDDDDEAREPSFRCRVAPVSLFTRDVYRLNMFAFAENFLTDEMMVVVGNIRCKRPNFVCLLLLPNHRPYSCSVRQRTTGNKFYLT